VENVDYAQISEAVRDAARLKTLPLSVKYMKSHENFPEKTRRPAKDLGKRVTICQAVSMARIYGWTIGLTKEDLICVPAMIAFGFSGAEDTGGTLGELFCEVGFHPEASAAAEEADSICKLDNDEYPVILIAPLSKGLFEPDIVVFYGNPAQIIRLSQAVVHACGKRIAGSFGGKVECTEYLVAPFKTAAPRIAIPGLGDRVFSVTQDDELVLSIPGKLLSPMYRSLNVVGKKVGIRYPVPSYLNYQPEFPPIYREMAGKLKLF
jgi:uncharacterized protein (DUF169 family)